MVWSGLLFKEVSINFNNLLTNDDFVKAVVAREILAPLYEILNMQLTDMNVFLRQGLIIT